MKRIISSAILCVCSLVGLFAQVNAEDFLQIVSMESEQGTQAVFTSAGMGISKEEAEVNAVKSLFYTLMFQGVDGVNGNKPLVVADNKVYTNSFFNRQARYNVYVVGSERVGKFEKVGDSYEVIFSNRVLLELTAKGSHKGGSALWVADYMGIDPQHLYCVGDNQNDLPMLQAAKIGFAPENCNQILRDWGAHIVRSCDEGCVAAVIEILDRLYA